MILILAGLALAALAALAVWRAADRFWHLGVVALLTAPLVPLLASTVTGDMSRYLPASLFSDGAAGKDEAIVASAASTVMLAVILAACLFAIGKALWRQRSATGATPEDR